MRNELQFELQESSKKLSPALGFGKVKVGKTKGKPDTRNPGGNMI